MTDYMLDLETLGTSAGAQIINIALVEFEKDIGAVGNRLDLWPCLQEHRGYIEEDTVAWHLKRGAHYPDLGRDSREAVSFLLKEFFGSMPEGSKVWAKSPGFDCVILQAWLEINDLPTAPWSFRDERDVRTIVKLAADAGYVGKTQDPETAHFGMDDAIAQVRDVSGAYRYMTGFRGAEAVGVGDAF